MFYKLLLLFMQPFKGNSSGKLNNFSDDEEGKNETVVDIQLDCTPESGFEINQRYGSNRSRNCSPVARVSSESSPCGSLTPSSSFSSGTDGEDEGWTESQRKKSSMSKALSKSEANGLSQSTEFIGNNLPRSETAITILSDDEDEVQWPGSRESPTSSGFSPADAITMCLSDPQDSDESINDKRETEVQTMPDDNINLEVENDVSGVRTRVLKSDERNTSFASSGSNVKATFDSRSGGKVSSRCKRSASDVSASIQSRSENHILWDDRGTRRAFTRQLKQIFLASQEKVIGQSRSQSQGYRQVSRLRHNVSKSNALRHGRYDDSDFYSKMESFSSNPTENGAYSDNEASLASRRASRQSYTSTSFLLGDYSTFPDPDNSNSTKNYVCELPLKESLGKFPKYQKRYKRASSAPPRPRTSTPINNYLTRR